MKAYILTFSLAWAIFSIIYAGCIALAIGMFSFLFWDYPDGIAYLTLLRWVTVVGFITTLFYMPSKEGKDGLKAMQGVWK